MNKRSEDILLATVKEYIRTGLPVSSQALFADFDFGIRPASIRAELNTLEEAGWLEQPHTSGGRIPTDKALELFSENILEELITKEYREKNILEMAELIIEGELKNFVQEFSKSLHLLSAGFDEDSPLLHTSGLYELFNCIDYNNSKVFYDIAKDLEHLEERMAELLEDKNVKTKDGPQTLIGKKSPLIRNDQVSTIFDIFEIDDRRMIFAAFGPRNMDYRKNFKVFLTIKDALSNYEQ